MAQYPPPPLPDQQHYTPSFSPKAQTTPTSPTVSSSCGLANSSVDSLAFVKSSNITSITIPNAESSLQTLDNKSNLTDDLLISGCVDSLNCDSTAITTTAPPHDKLHDVVNELENSSKLIDNYETQSQNNDKSDPLTASTYTPHSVSSGSNVKVVTDVSFPATNANTTSNFTYTNPTASPSSNSKTNRLKKACDSCSVRKVKCDEFGPPCRACAVLDIPCTYERPNRRRGPPNRLAEALKKRKRDSDWSSLIFSSPGSTTNSTSPSLSSILPVRLSIDDICPRDALPKILDLFFSYIHPLHPFPFELSFREGTCRPEEIENTSLLTLYSSIIAYVSAVLPWQVQKVLNALNLDSQVNTSSSIIFNRALDTCCLARGTDFMNRRNCCLYDAAASFYLAVATAAVSRPKISAFYFSECFTLLRLVDVYPAPMELDSSDMSTASTSTSSSSLPELLRKEMGSRIFWSLYMTEWELELVDISSRINDIPLEISSGSCPSLPIVLDSSQLSTLVPYGQSLETPESISGFNRIVRLYIICADTFNSDSPKSFRSSESNRSLTINSILTSLKKLKEEINLTPPEFAMWPRKQPNGQEMQIQSVSQVSSPSKTFDFLDEYNSVNQSLEVLSARTYFIELSLRIFLFRKFLSITRSDTSGNPDSANSVSKPSDNLDEVAMANGIFMMNFETFTKDVFLALCRVNQTIVEHCGLIFLSVIHSITLSTLQLSQNLKNSLFQASVKFLQNFLDTFSRLKSLYHHIEIPNPSDPNNNDLSSLWSETRDLQIQAHQWLDSLCDLS